MLEKCLPALIMLKIFLIIMQLLPRFSNNFITEVANQKTFSVH